VHRNLCPAAQIIIVIAKNGSAKFRRDPFIFWAPQNLFASWCGTKNFVETIFSFLSGAIFVVPKISARE